MSEASKLLLAVGLLMPFVFESRHTEAQEAIDGLAATQALRETQELPESLSSLRAEQGALASEHKLDIRTSDEGERSVSMLSSVPPELRGIPVTSERDLERLLPSLYKYYAFTGSESLRFERKRQSPLLTQYYFREFIGELKTLSTMTIWVETDGRVTHIGGWLHIDRGVSDEQAPSSDSAIDTLLAYFAGRPDEETASYALTSINRFRTEQVLMPSAPDQALRLGWQIDVPLRWSNDPEHGFGTFYVDFNGYVISTDITVF